MTTAPNFDRLARPYRWLEYLTFGPLLHRTRTHYLARLNEARTALVLGDGDGRFTHDLFVKNPHIHVHAVDLSAAMLQQLRGRCNSYEDRLKTTQSNALDLPFTQFVGHDLIVTHFFLDCFTQPQIEKLIPSLANTLEPVGFWLVSDFNIPNNAARLPAKVLVGILYAAFRFLTGLKPNRLPDYRNALQAAGLRRIAVHQRLLGILTSELWCKAPLP